MLEGAGELHRQLGRLRVIRGALEDRPDPGDEGFGRFQVLGLEGLLGVAHQQHPFPLGGELGIPAGGELLGELRHRGLGLAVAQLREEHQTLELHPRGRQAGLILRLRLSEDLVGHGHRRHGDLAEERLGLLPRRRLEVRLVELVDVGEQFLGRTIRDLVDLGEAVVGLLLGGGGIGDVVNDHLSRQAPAGRKTDGRGAEERRAGATGTGQRKEHENLAGIRSRGEQEGVDQKNYLVDRNGVRPDGAIRPRLPLGDGASELCDAGREDDRQPHFSPGNPAAKAGSLENPEDPSHRRARRWKPRGAAGSISGRSCGPARSTLGPERASP